MLTSPDSVAAPSAASPRATTGGLLVQIAGEISCLLRQELALARAEISHEIGQLGAGIAAMVVGGVVLFVALVALVAAAVCGLALILPPWASCLIVGAVLLVIGIGLLLAGRHGMASANLMPRRTLRSLRDDASFAREQVR